MTFDADDPGRDPGGGATTMPPIRTGALHVALALGLGWALFLAYEVQRTVDVSRSILSVPSATAVFFFLDQWAAPAVAIVVVVWLCDLALVRLRP